MLLFAEAAPTPQDQFLQIYFLLQEAENLEKSGQKNSAVTRYQEVEKRLQTLKKDNPQWEPVIVNFRLKYVRDKMASLGANNMPVVSKPETVPQKPSPIVSQVNPGLPSNNSAPVSPVIAPPAPAPVVPVVTAPVVEASPIVPSTSAPEASRFSSNMDETTVLKARIVVLEKEVNDYKQKYLESLEETNRVRTRLENTEKELASVKSGNVDSRVAQLLKDNNTLKDQLAQAEQSMRQLRGGGAADVNVINLQSQLKKVQDQLALLENENQAYRQTTTELKSQLETAQRQLADGGSGKNDEQLRQENDVLRNIINRQLQEQARRDAAKRLALEELLNLKVKSEVLRQQIDLLSSPLVVLSADELAMLHTPMNVDIISPDQGFKAPLNNSSNNMDSNGAPSIDQGSTVSSRPSRSTSSRDDAGASYDYRTKAVVPEEVRSLAQEASDLFARKRYAEAAEKYKTMAERYPESLYAWSNLGVTRFQMQDLPGAEEALKQAIKLNPNDYFSHSSLGIVYYQMNRYDDAVQVLTKATTLEPNDARSHNFLGIACSQKGWQEAAEQEFRKAVELDPSYGDAHFNLAVIYATQNPPSKELSRKHYKKALETGIPKDPQLEKRIGS
ncbi:MAG: tetratricopeptide repeat protein [Verrucomicrobiota bacterium]